MCKRLIYHCSVTHIQLMRIIATRRQQSLRYWSGRQCNAHIISVGRMECRRDGDKWRRARQNCVQLGSFFAGKTTQSSLRWTDGSFGDPISPYHSLSPSGPPPPSISLTCLWACLWGCSLPFSSPLWTPPPPVYISYMSLSVSVRMS